MADGLPEDFPSGLAHRDGRLTKPAASLTYLQRRTRAGRLKAATSLLSKPPQQTASNAGPRLRARRAKNFLPKKRPVTRRQTAAAASLGAPAILKNRSPCQETGIQASSSNEVAYPEKPM
ncbi:hypothetical protein MRX96_044105 [Rhipicephalus microplus]